MEIKLTKLCMIFSMALLFESCADSDSGGSSNSSSSSSSASVTYQTASCSETDANSTASGGDAFCYTIDAGTLVQIAEDGSSNLVYAYQYNGDQVTKLGIKRVGDLDGIELIFQAGANGVTPGTYPLMRFTQYYTAEGKSPSRYLAIGSNEGAGTVTITEFEGVGGKIKGSFDMTLCGYNSRIHQIQCGLSSANIKGSFEMTRDRDEEGTVTNPYGDQYWILDSLTQRKN